MSHILSAGASTDRRPDAISLDYRTAYSFGPVQQGDNSLGSINRVWRVRATDTEVYVARANDAGTAFEAETLLFAYIGAAITEVDIAFDQAGRILIAAERPTGAAGVPEVWIYWFKPLDAAFVFESFGRGRTPRAILDAPNHPDVADIVVFYLNDETDRLSYRQQRDNYAIETALQYGAPPQFVTASNRFLEDAYVATDSRVHVLYSTRDIVSGRYTLAHVESALYPVSADIEGFTPGVAPLIESELIRLVKYVWPQGLDTGGLPSDGEIEVESFQTFEPVPLVTSELRPAILFIETYGSAHLPVDAWQDAEEFDTEAVPLATSTLVVAGPIVDPLNDIDEFKTAALPQAASTLLVVVIVDPLNDVDEFKVATVPLNTSTLAP